MSINTTIRDRWHTVTNFSDYSKKRTNLNNFLPDTLRNAISESLNENLFNRFLTKNELRHIVGIIGDADTTNFGAPNVEEFSAFNQRNQLQPIAHTTVGTVDKHMTFLDMMRRLDMAGVDVDSFNIWGRSLQFNWVPPIDIDKLVNFRDYYWDSATPNEQPDYITIRNQCNWSTSRYNQITNSLASVLPQKALAASSGNTVSLVGNVVSQYTVGQHIILHAPPVTSEYNRVASVTFNNLTLNTDLVLENTIQSTDYEVLVSLDIPVLSTLDETSITIQGDLSSVLKAGYPIRTNTSPTTYNTVVESSYNQENNVTTVVLREGSPTLVAVISLSPEIFISAANSGVVCSAPSTLTMGTPWDESSIGEIIWNRIFVVVPETTGGTIVPGDSGMNDISADFVSSGVEIGHKLIIHSGPNRGEYFINGVSPDRVDIVAEAKFFGDTSVSYSIVYEKSFAALSTQPPTPAFNEYWYDAYNDELYQYDTGWNLVARGLSSMLDTIGDAYKIKNKQTDDWSASNRWVHKSQLSTLTGRSRAQAPIIEFKPHLNFAEGSFSKKRWSYRRIPDVEYIEVSEEPTLFELVDITLSQPGDIVIVDSTTIRLSEKYGNIAVGYAPGDQIVLEGFLENSAVYQIAAIDFIQSAPGTRYFTEISLVNPLPNVSDLPVGATIYPRFTSRGDLYFKSNRNWRLDGVDTITASSAMPDRNPMLDEFVSYDDTNPVYDSNIGLYWQSYKVKSGTISGLYLDLHQDLHDLVLHDDYQEGDIRIYINGKRVYGVYDDVASSLNPDFVGGIQFHPDFIISEDDLVKVELGEYAKDEIGYRALVVNTIGGDELYNLVGFRKIEQTKTEKNQYPLFAVYDIYGNPLNTASKIFTYKEDADSPVDRYLLKRVVYNPETRDFTFENGLVEKNSGKILSYFDRDFPNDPYQTVWKRGLNNEQYAPRKVAGEWEIPNQWYYNSSHENREEVKLTDVFRHFSSIIAEQETYGVVSVSGNTFFANPNPNYGLGGTIKEHNDSFDTLVSSAFVEDSSIVDVIAFAKAQYRSQLNWFKTSLRDGIADLLVSSTSSNITSASQFISNEIINAFEQNSVFNLWFGDSTNTGISGFIATLPTFGIIPKIKPHAVVDETLGIHEIVHHDGHRRGYEYNNTELQVVIDSLVKKGVPVQDISTPSDPFPTTINGEPADTGDLIIRRLTKVNRTIHRLNSIGNWELVDPSSLLLALILEVERRLYDGIPSTAEPENFVPRYNFTNIRNNSKYHQLMERKLQGFRSGNETETPFSQSNPFTWNYSYSTIPSPPFGGPPVQTKADWRAVYNDLYGTPYPHREPWRIQGYLEKPDWWEDEYADISGTRIWTTVMWDNILSGTIPVGRDTFDGDAGTGTPFQITAPSYVPVNISNTVIGGYLPDGILPPYWDSSLTVPGMSTPFDANLQQTVVTPQLPSIYGTEGAVEWDWVSGTDRAYDELMVAFSLDPMKMLNTLFGNEYVEISCLQVDTRTEMVFRHQNTLFHGEALNDISAYKVNGINQWITHFYRFNAYDGVSADYNGIWKSWEMALSYDIGSFTSPEQFQIFNPLVDITSKDFSIDVKKTPKLDKKSIDSLTVEVSTIPAQFSKVRDLGIGWSFNIFGNSPYEDSITIGGVQNYPVSINSDSSLSIDSYKLRGAGLDLPQASQVISYGQTLRMSRSTGLQNTGYVYQATVTVDGTNVINISIPGQRAQTVSQLIAALNDILGGAAEARVNLGDLEIRSTETGISSAIQINDIDLFGSVTGFFEVKSPQIQNIKFNRYFDIDGNHEIRFPVGGRMVIQNSTEYNGEYTILGSVFSDSMKRTRVFVDDNVAVNSAVVDGEILPLDRISYPEEWVTGTIVYVSSTGALPSPLIPERPYTITRVDDHTILLNDSVLGAPVILGNTGTMTTYVGALETTFRTENGVVWRNHKRDGRITRVVHTPVSVSGIQQLIDFIDSYSGHLEDEGFIFTSDFGRNVDRATGRANDWQLELEKFINWAYELRSIRDNSTTTYPVTADISTSSFTSTVPMPWANGTAVVFDVADTDELPDAFNSVMGASVNYYVVRTTDPAVIKLAASSYDASVGAFIPFSTAGAGIIRLKRAPINRRLPRKEMNPIRENLYIANTLGILDDIFDSGTTSVNTNKNLYDNFGMMMDVGNTIIARTDKRSHITITKDQIEGNNRQFVYNAAQGGIPVVATINTAQPRFMAGGTFTFTGYSHIVRFSDYSTDGRLIYDSFLGLRTPRFFVEFDRQPEFTLRPAVGGYAFTNGKLVQNIESTIDDSRRYYDVYTTLESNISSKQARRSLGYTGTVDYMDSIQINPKTQFQFWKGMIQNKGTNFAVNAFTNQTIYSSAEVDEFFAYKLAEFGDSKDKLYMDMNLFVEDVVTNDLRVEFTTPDGGVTDSSFTEIRLTDTDRWFNQPDQIEKFSPRQAFFFDVKFVETFENPLAAIQTINGMTLLELGLPADGAIVTYTDSVSGNRVELKAGIDYEFINAVLIRFIGDVTLWPELKVATLSYNYDAHNPSKIIDKKAQTVVSDVQIWNPALDQHYHIAAHIVDIQNVQDPADYTVDKNGVVSDEAFWSDDRVGTVWMDMSLASYKPYYDKAIYPSIDDRIFKWGELADWANIKLYRWTRSNVPPAEYDDLVEEDRLNKTKPVSEKLTGSSYKLVYRNMNPDLNGEPAWQLDETVYEEYVAATVDGSTVSGMSGVVQVYRNGVFDIILDLDVYTLSDYVSAPLGVIPGQTVKPSLPDYITLLKPAHVPTVQELDEGRYKYDAPYSVKQVANPITGEAENIYYYWVSDTEDAITVNGRYLMNIREAESQIKRIPAPYMILQGLTPPDTGYGVIYGIVFDEDDYGLPYRYNQLIVRGLERTVKDEDRYVLRLTHDFTLRADYNTSNLKLGNKHEEWKLFRRKQLSKIDLYLWERVVEAVTGRPVYNRVIDFSAPELPTRTRVVYDSMYNTNTRYGLGEEQVLVDGETAKATIMSILVDPTRNFNGINIIDFLNRNSFVTAVDSAALLYEIYDTFPIRDVNDIFFEVLLDALTGQNDFAGIMKTSWVALQLVQTVSPPPAAPDVDLGLIPGGDCFLGDIVEPTPPPLPPPSPTPSPVYDCLRITEEGEFRETEEDVLRTPESCEIEGPTPTPTPTPTPECVRETEEGVTRETEEDEVRIPETCETEEPQLFAIRISEDEFTLLTEDERQRITDNEV